MTPIAPTAPIARIALIHATPLAIAPINDAFARLWPAVQRMNLLDDSLSQDRARDGDLTPAMVRRFEDLAVYAKGTGADGILFTCSAFGPAIEAAARAVGIPTLKPNEAMFRQALDVTPAKAGVVGRGSTLGLLATFEASIPSMSDELHAMARQAGTTIHLRTAFVPQAMADLAAGDAAQHDERIAIAARDFHDCDAVMLAQFSMAAAQPRVQRELRCPVLSSPDCAVAALRQALATD